MGAAWAPSVGAVGGGASSPSLRTTGAGETSGRVDPAAVVALG